MANQSHLSIDDLLRIHDGELADGELTTMGRHLTDCDQCSAVAHEMFGSEASQLPRVVPIASRSSRTMPFLLAAAAIIAVVIGIAFFMRKPPRPIPIARSPWDQLKTSVVREGAIAAPAIVTAVRVNAAEQLRGENTAQPARSLEPNGIVVDDTRPRFHWRADAGTSVVVSIFENGAQAGRSESLHSDSWTPPNDLRRGAVYQWQLEVTKEGRLHTVPAAPHLPCTFAIVSDDAHRELAEAELRAPSDHLLLGILAARGGLQQKALAEFALVDSPDARKLAESVRKWP